MSQAHHAVTILPSGAIDASGAFYKRLGTSGRERLWALSHPRRGRGWHLHLNQVDGWPRNIEDNPIGIYLYVEDVDAVAAGVRELIIEQGAPHLKPWGTYEFSVSDPSGTLVRVGRIAD